MLYTYVYTCICIHILIYIYIYIKYIRKFDLKKEAMLLKDSKERYVSGF